MKQSQTQVVYENKKITTFEPCSEVDANILSKIFFFWTHDLMKRGAQKPLQMNNLSDLKLAQQPKACQEQFQKIDQEVAGTQIKNKTLYSFKKFVGGSFVASGLFAAFANALQFSGPLMINQILNFLDPRSTEPTWKGVLWASILVFCYLVRTVVFQHAMHNINLTAVRIMNAATAKVYNKILRLSSASRKYLETGAIMNYINVDIQAFQFFVQMSTFLFSAPVMIVVAIALVIRQVGWIGISAPIMFFIGVQAQNYLMKKAIMLRKDQLHWSDKRSKCVNQYFSGIRIVKYYGWQEIVSNKIQSIRRQQIKLVFRNLILRGYVEILMNMLPIFASILVFAVFVVLNGAQKLTPAKVYTTLSLFNLMSNPMRMLIMTLINYANAKAGLARIDHFFQYQQIRNDGFNDQDQTLEVGQIKIQQTQFRWQTQQAKKHFEQGKKLTTVPKKPAGKQQKKQQKKQEKKTKPKKTKKVTGQNGQTLKKKKKKKKVKKNQLKKQSVISQDSLTTPLLQGQQKILKDHEHISLKIENLHIKNTEFIGVVGQVGSGKSTFLSAILNQVDKIQGTIKRRGTIAYIPQTSWLRSATIRQNILFQSEYDQQKYKHVLSICELQSDLQILGGDLTEVGERGVNLSGGQKQRISIARALYADADIYLIDDCLSALDVYVSKKIFNNVIKKQLEFKTVIFVTHALHLVKQCDRIIVMNKGRIQQLGTFQELINNKDSLFNNLQVQYQRKQKQQALKQEEKKKQQAEIKKKKTQILIDQPKQQKKQKQVSLVKVQQRLKGSVPWGIYYRFFTGAGFPLTISMLTFVLLGQFSRVASDWWIGSWSVNTFHLPTQQYLWIYAVLSLVVGILIYFKNIFFAKFIVTSSQNLQRKLIQVLLKTPLYWFDVTPTGRILSRTTKDQDDLDSNLAFNVQMSLQNLLIMFSSILIIGIVTPLYFVFAAVSLIIYYFLIKFYMLTAVELKRLQANTRAPLISHIQQTINGIYVIRAFNRRENFVRKFFEKQKNYIVAYVNQNIANRWISLITDLFAIVAIGGAAYLGVLEKGKTTSNLIGLSLIWSLQISAILSFTLKLMADTESNMNAVIRLLQYIDNNPAQKDFNQPKPPSEQWPHEGKYKFNNITYRYRKQLDNVIHGISFDVQANSKIGVVGRTGSGKSTLTLGLLRILQLIQDPQGNKGQIILDGLNIQNLGLHHLRHKVTIIPQDPTLFSGSIRSNIDPFNLYKDQEIVQALKKVQIWNQIRPNAQEKGQIQQKINSLVDSSGSNFSLGQRQLICMARALIRKPKILLMDQATASIDQKTDSLIQKMIRKQFKDTTVITIAHRLNTIINYDKILVLDYGKIKQYAKPLDLVQDETSFLGKLIKQTGKEYQQMIIQLAKRNREDLDKD